MRVRPTIQLEQIDTLARELAHDYGVKVPPAEGGHDTNERYIGRDFPDGEHIGLSYREITDWDMSMQGMEGVTDSSPWREYRRDASDLYESNEGFDEHKAGPTGCARALLGLIALRKYIEHET